MLRLQRITRPAATAVLGALLLAVLGCGGGDGPDRYRVWGTITLDGKPVPAGTILFDPDSTKGKDGPQGYSVIRDGKYDTSQGGNGAVGGPHRVRISGFDGTGVNDDAPYGRPVFLNYQTTVDLPKETSEQNFNVPDSARGK